jgi:hypothetical protein
MVHVLDYVVGPPFILTSRTFVILIVQIGFSAPGLCSFRLVDLGFGARHSAYAKKVEPTRDAIPSWIWGNFLVL